MQNIQISSSTNSVILDALSQLEEPLRSNAFLRSINIRTGQVFDILDVEEEINFIKKYCSYGVIKESEATVFMFLIFKYLKNKYISKNKNESSEGSCELIAIFQMFEIWFK